jgi:hypothetical protein
VQMGLGGVGNAGCAVTLPCCLDRIETGGGFALVPWIGQSAESPASLKTEAAATVAAPMEGTRQTGVDEAAACEHRRSPRHLAA